MNKLYKITGTLVAKNGKIADKVEFFPRPFESAEDAALWLSLNYPCYLLDSEMYEVNAKGHRKLGGDSVSFHAKDYLTKGMGIDEAISKIQEIIEVGFFNMALATA